MRKVLIILSWLLSFSLYAMREPEFSTAGFFSLLNSGRTVYSMNVAWKFYKGDIAEAYSITFNDENWESVSLPHGIEYLPVEASGTINYKGICLVP